MQLTVRDVARLLNVSEKSVYRWIKEESIPAYRVNDQYRFNRAELLEWATARRVGVSVELLQEESEGETAPSLCEALTAGGVAYRVGGGDKESALREVVSVMRLPEEVDRELLLRVLVAREELASTAIGDGIAIPHVRAPIVLHVSRPTITLCFLEQPVDFGALDGQPVDCLFTMVSPSVRAHLHLLSRLAFVLRDSGIKDVLQRRGLREEVFAEFGRAEAALGAPVEVEGAR